VLRGATENGLRVLASRRRVTTKERRVMGRARKPDRSYEPPSAR
jgi:hypothetical protein